MLASYSVGATAGRPWFVNQAEGGGQVLERASHHIDLQCAIAGPVEWVQAAGARVDLAGADRPADSDIDDVLTLTLGFRSGAIGSVLVAWTSPELPSTYTLDVVSARSSVHVELDPGFTARGTARGAEVSLGLTMAPIRRGMERFLEAVRAGDPGLVACAVDAAAESLEWRSPAEPALRGRGPGRRGGMTRPRPRDCGGRLIGAGASSRPGRRRPTASRSHPWARACTAGARSRRTGCTCFRARSTATSTCVPTVPCTSTTTRSRRAASRPRLAA